MAEKGQAVPTTESPHFATLVVMALAPEEVGQRIERARKAKGWTHEEFRDHAREHLADPHINLRTVQRWQKGRNPKDGKSWLPRLGRLMALAELLDVPRSYFVESEADEDAGAWGQALARLDGVEATLEEILRLVRGDPAEPRAGGAED